MTKVQKYVGLLRSCHEVPFVKPLIVKIVKMGSQVEDGECFLHSQHNIYTLQIQGHLFNVAWLAGCLFKFIRPTLNRQKL